jgi:hypothetical protein
VLILSSLGRENQWIITGEEGSNARRKVSEQVLSSRLKRLIAEYGNHELSKEEVLRNAENILTAHVIQVARLGVRETALRMGKSPDIMPPELQKQLNGIVAEKLAEVQSHP